MAYTSPPTSAVARLARAVGMGARSRHLPLPLTRRASTTSNTGPPSPTLTNPPMARICRPTLATPSPPRACRSGGRAIHWLDRPAWSPVMLGSVLNRGAAVDGAAKAVMSTTVMTPSQRSRLARRVLIGVGVQSSMAFTPQVGLRCADLDRDVGFDPSQRAAGTAIGLAWIADLAVRCSQCWGNWLLACRKDGGPMCGDEVLATRAKCSGRLLCATAMSRPILPELLILPIYHLIHNHYKKCTDAHPRSEVRRDASPSSSRSSSCA
jgi:hypothetical protein